jgi:hypothetical protein
VLQMLGCLPDRAIKPNARLVSARMQCPINNQQEVNQIKLHPTLVINVDKRSSCARLM